MSSPASDPRKVTCPFLGILDEDGKPAPYVEYPSLENRCFVSGQPTAIMLTEQATFCLARGYRHCPLLVAAQAKPAGQRGASTSPPSPQPKRVRSTTAADPLQRDIEEMEAELQAAYVTRSKSRRRWGWFGAAMIFVSSLLCGGIFAGYVGWQLVSRDSLAVAPGTLGTLAEASPAVQPQVYLIVTATSAPLQQPQPAQQVPGMSSQSQAAFPPAVTPTPIVVQPPVGSGEQAIPATGLTGPMAIATAPMDMQLEIPTRRPTPFLDLSAIAASTPEPSPTLTNTPTPALGTPVVIFAAQDEALKPGECTTITWHVENVNAVYYENIGVDGHGEAEECIRDKAGDYVLTVVLPNGATRYYTATVDLIGPTETPTPTRTIPPEIKPTITWTPDIPTSTPTPDYQYAVLLAVEGGGKRTCSPGETCQFSLLVTNASITIDNISILVLEAGAWGRQLCRLDGVCSDAKLTLASVGPSNTALVHFKVIVPGDASAATERYVVRAISDGSQGQAGSDAVALEVVVE